MKAYSQIDCQIVRHSIGSASLGIVLLLLNLWVQLPARGQGTAKTFASPEEAVAALGHAVSSQDQAALQTIFGPAWADLQNPDRVQATNECSAFAAALDQTSHLIHDSDTKCVLEVGTNFWPFPIPIVKQEGRWFFDTKAGQEELQNRRVGRNELAVLQVMRAYVDAQRDYASRDRDGTEVLKYAQKLSSSPGKQDGLYWPPTIGGEGSPLGPLVAFAQGEGYRLPPTDDDEEPGPFHGYYFKILTRQGKHAPGGKYDYVINGNMIGGFAMVAWPSDYGDSGIMTFIVNQQGRVYQKDLGPKTAKIAAGMKVYDPDPSWVRSPD
jgi:hypothetical protein